MCQPNTPSRFNISGSISGKQPLHFKVRIKIQWLYVLREINLNVIMFFIKMWVPRWCMRSTNATFGGHAQNPGQDLSRENGMYGYPSLGLGVGLGWKQLFWLDRIQLQNKSCEMLGLELALGVGLGWKQHTARFLKILTVAVSLLATTPVHMRTSWSEFKKRCLFSHFELKIITKVIVQLMSSLIVVR